jgi:phosphotransferase system enzyme I (PtsI)
MPAAGSPPETRVFKGISASPGIAIGKAFVLEDMDLAVGRWQVPPEAVKAEVSRFRLAVADTRKEMVGTQQKILKLLGKTHARLIEAYLLILEDPLISKDVVKNITANRVNAEYALSEAVAGAVKTLEAATDEYFRERRHDVLDVGRKILLHLLGHEPQDLEDLDEPSVIVARNLTPSDTIHMKTQFAEGFATDIGGRTSHTAILANSLEIPAVVGLHEITRHVRPGDMMILDGYTGTVILNPLADVVDNYRREREIRGAERRDLERLRDQPAQTPDGRRIALAGNIDSPGEVKNLLANGAEGVGLYRTEFLYLNRAGLPTEEDHYRFYAKVAQSVLPHPVILRTMDIGGDKLVDLGFPELTKSEQNPFFGPAGDSSLVAAPGLVSHSVARDPSRVGPWESADHVSHGVRHRGISRRAENLKRVHGRTSKRERFLRRKNRGGAYDRSPFRRARRGLFGPGSGFHVHRHQRPDPIHPGRRPGQRRSVPFV